MELSPRLKKIADLIPQCNVLADVGTDHAYIPAYCFLNEKCNRAIAMDVNKGPLERAENTLKKYGFEKKTELRLSDGLEKLYRSEADVIVVAGMGGLLIRDIISCGVDVINNETILLLQPMNAPVELRDWLNNNDFYINEYVVREENKFYNIFLVKKGKMLFDDIAKYIGNNLSVNSPDVFSDYLEFKMRVCNKIISGMKKSDNPDLNAIKHYEFEKKIYSSALNK